MNASYYVMAPEGNKELKVTETRIIHYYDTFKKEWVELGYVDQEIIAALGTRRAEGRFELPSDIPEGSYRVTLKVSAEEVEDQAMQELTVKKGLAKELQELTVKKGLAKELSDSRTQPQQVQTVYTGYSQTEQYGDKAVERPMHKGGKRLSIKVMSKTLNVRQEPSSKSAIVGVIKQGEVYEIIKSEVSGQNKWFRIRLEDGTEGWVIGKYVKLTE